MKGKTPCPYGGNCRQNQAFNEGKVNCFEGPSPFCVTACEQDASTKAVPLPEARGKVIRVFSSAIRTGVTNPEELNWD